MAPSSPQSGSEPDPANRAGSSERPSDSSDSAHSPEADQPRDSAAGAAPLADDRADTAGTKHAINPARMEVRLRRIALIGLVLVPLIYFLVQSLR